MNEQRILEEVEQLMAMLAKVDKDVQEMIIPLEQRVTLLEDKLDHHLDAIYKIFSAILHELKERDPTLEARMNEAVKNAR